MEFDLQNNSMKVVALLNFFLLMCCCVKAATIKGKLVDENKEPLTGATVLLDVHKNIYAVAGLDGSYLIKNVPSGTYTLKGSFIGYQALEKTITIASESDAITVDFDLVPDSNLLNEIVISGKAEAGSDMEARTIEKTSPQVVNVLSAKAISLLPDLSVANLVQRVSGLTVQRNSNGDPQYAIVRGMDKRYSYTLVNGLKIPSPDNKNRYVPLDIFPANMLERLEVYKSLTADMEGDAIGGAVNMVMKSAPDHFEVKADFQAGYNYINTLYGFDHYDGSGIAKQSPRQLYGTGYMAQTPGDFTTKNLEVTNSKPIPDMIASFSVGNRFLKNKLGVLVGASFQNSYRGTKSLWFDYDVDPYGSDLPQLASLQERHYSIQQMRGAVHARLDYKFDDKNEIKFYTGYYSLNNNETREIRETSLKLGYSSAQGNASLDYTTRTKTTDQGIFTSSLQGTHKLFEPLTLTWSAVHSVASNNEPDNAKFTRSSTMIDYKETPQGAESLTRQWLNNTDVDLTGYLNLIFQPKSWGKSLLKTGGMIRHKDRDSNYDIYYFDPNPTQQFQGVNWNTVSDVTWSLTNPLGAPSDAQNYNAHEYIHAAYALGKLDVEKWEVNTGVRVENTNMGYALKNPAAGVTPDSTQHYTDVLPSLMAKYKIKPGTNLRFSYYKGISRPGFFEIVPYIYPDDGYPEHGNPNLKRSKAQNLDLRWEVFPNVTDQILVGAFYKYITDPIEYTVTKYGIANENVLQPNNFGNAKNMGLEVDFTHYFNKFGIRANYTYTHSTITTPKQLPGPVDPNDLSKGYTTYFVDQTRPMQGQAKHVGNLSLLYKNLDKGWESQLSMVYIGEKLEAVSPYLDNDLYSKPIIILDFSLEKKVSRTIDVFMKATNLLNSPYQMFIKKPVYQQGNEYPYQNDPHNKTLARRDEYYQSFRLGARIKFNKY
jgi:outer membrane receptor protein involved in Fe transport